MPTIAYPNVGEVLKHEFVRGEILTVDSATDTCTVLVAGRTVTALLFYHCTPESVIRDNGAIEGAAAGFQEGDAVIVQTNRDDPEEFLVVAHVDGVRHCGLQLRLWTATGFLVDNSYLSTLMITIVNSNRETISGDYYTYKFIDNKDNPSKGYWQFTINIPPELDTSETGYWINYDIGGKHLKTQYPNRYGSGTSLFWQSGDLIQLSGLYEDTLHYLDYSETMSPWPDFSSAEIVRSSGGGLPVFASGPNSGWGSGYGAMYIGNNTSITFTITIKSTMPVKISKWGYNRYLYRFVADTPPGWSVTEHFLTGTPNPLYTSKTEYSDGYSIEDGLIGETHGGPSTHVWVYGTPSATHDIVIATPSMAGATATMTKTFTLSSYVGQGGICANPEEGSGQYITSWTESFTDLVFIHAYQSALPCYPAMYDPEISDGRVILNPLKQSDWGVSLDTSE